MSKLIDLTGQKFGRWIVIQRAENNKQGRSQWLCQCSCPNKTIKIVSSGALRAGKSLSCGCYQKETASKCNFKGFNHYEFFEDYVKGYDFKGRFFIIDKEDYDKVKNIKWSYSKGYWNSLKLKISLHRFIMNIQDKTLQIDHKNKKRNDCRKDNLRITTQQNNLFNKTLSRSNTSNYIGVSWNKRFNKWESYLWYQNKRVFHKYYDTIEEAIKERLKAELQYFGEYAPQKELFEQYGVK